MGRCGRYVVAQKVYRWSGSSWIESPLPAQTTPQAITGFGSTVLVAAARAANQLVLRWTGADWDATDITAELNQPAYLGIGGRAADDLYVFGYGTDQAVHFDGVNWQHAAAPSSVFSIAAVGDALFAGTLTGSERESPDWLVDLSAIATKATTMRDQSRTFVTGTGCNDLTVAVGVANTAVETQQTEIIRFDGTGWRVETSVTMVVRALATASDGTVYAITAEGDVLRRVASGWATFTHLDLDLRSIAVSPSGHLAVGGRDGRVYRYDGTWRTEVVGTGPVGGIVMLSDRDIVAVVDGGLAAFDGTSWSRVALPPDPARALVDIWGAPSGEVFSVGARGRSVQRIDGVWQIGAPMPFHDFEIVRGAAANDVFALSRIGDLAHFDGARWSPVRVVLPGGGTSLWGTATCTYIGGLGVPVSLHRLVRRTQW